MSKAAPDTSTTPLQDLLQGALADAPPADSKHIQHLAAHYWRDEGEAVRDALAVLDETTITPADEQAVHARALALAGHLRAMRTKIGGVDALMQEYDLSSQEGVVLMCLAEAMLRIPDIATQAELVSEQIGNVDWQQHPVNSPQLLVHASVWGMMLAKGVVGISDPKATLRQMLKRLGAPVVSTMVRNGVRVLAHQFVLSQTPKGALERAAKTPHYRYSFDMLGEAACTAEAAQAYQNNYIDMLQRLQAPTGAGGIDAAPEVSVKLSALHPRYHPEQHHLVVERVAESVHQLAVLAKSKGVGLCVDAEEAERLELSMAVLECLSADSELAGWDGLGLAVQAYQKRAPQLLQWLVDRARADSRRWRVRLVKGAYWDYEIKRAQQHGLPGYPVYTRKHNSDVSYLACAQRLLDNPDEFYPCFATHNARTVAALEFMGRGREYEFQRLLGMGEALYERVLQDNPQAQCRVYAPVGGHKQLLAYLVRRLLENGANSSFINRLAHDDAPLEQVVADPVDRVRKQQQHAHPSIALPDAIFAPQRTASQGVDAGNALMLQAWREDLGATAFAPTGYNGGGEPRVVRSPVCRDWALDSVFDADADYAQRALQSARQAQGDWDAVGAPHRAAALNRAADEMEAQRGRLAGLLMLEAGRTFADAVDEVREAVDFLRYYAAVGEQLFERSAQMLAGPVGEHNTPNLRGRGVFMCISPWNFPLAIFTGQVAAALMAGNAVLAKCAEQTPLIAEAAVRILHASGVPADCLHLLVGDGAVLGEALLSRGELGGVAFTGSTATAQRINNLLAQSDGPIVPLIAETGGINAMLVDSTAVPERVTEDVLTSAFRSAGQRCSSLRLLCIQEDVFDEQLDMIVQATSELNLGDTRLCATDIGPIIDEQALQRLQQYCREMEHDKGFALLNQPLPEPEAGLFFAPRIYRIGSVDDLGEEVFGPVLHVLSYARSDLESLCKGIDALGYGLTLGVHSRIRSRVERICALVRAGNVYINRNQIGATVGVQPFGGSGLSGTGPKAGGPNYLMRFATERCITDNIAAMGGDSQLLSLDD